MGRASRVQLRFHATTLKNPPGISSKKLHIRHFLVRLVRSYRIEHIAKMTMDETMAGAYKLSFPVLFMVGPPAINRATWSRT